MLVEATGILVFDPPNFTKKQIQQSSWKYTAMVLVDDDTAAYYRWILQKRFNLKLDRQLRATHVTFISDRITDNQDIITKVAEHFNGKEIKFHYNINELESSEKHWWFKVYCDELLSIRELCGFSRRPYRSLHLTIGLANHKNLEHSEYIWWVIQNFNL